MKIYIVGPVSSGKSTLAKKLSETHNTPCHSLDEVVHIPDKSSIWGSRKREVEERDKMFCEIIQKPDWIIEDVGRTCFEDGLRKADIIILLDTPAMIRNYRIVKRWLKQRFHIEKCIYNPNIRMLKSMFKWSRNYETGKDELRKRISLYQTKLVTLKSNKDIDILKQKIFK